MSFTKTQNKFSKGIDDKSDDTAVTIDEAGNVGVGTDLPFVVNSKTTLHINDDTNGGAVRIGDSTTNMLIDCDTAEGTRIRANTGDMLVGTNQSGTDLTFITGSNPRLTVNSAGQIGIGTTLPDRRMVVSSTQNIIARMETTKENGGMLAFSDGLSTSIQDVRIGAVGDEFKILTANATRLTIDGSGNVGINQSDPSSLLSISAGYHASNSTSANIALRNRHSGNWYNNGIWSSGPNLKFSTGTLGTNGPSEADTALTIDNTGNVGIGIDPTTGTFDLSAKEQLKEWKTKAKKASWPIVTDGAFEQEPTEELVEQWIETRAAGDKLQVAGNISATGRVSAKEAGINYSNPDVPLCVGAIPGQNLVARFGTLADAGDDTYIRIQGRTTGGSNRYFDIRHILDDGALTINGPTSSLPEIMRITSDGATFSGTVNVAGEVRILPQGIHRWGKSGIWFSTNAWTPMKGDGTATTGETNLGASGNSFNNAFFSGTVNSANTRSNLIIQDGSPVIDAKGLISTLSTLRNATMDETTLEGMRDALSDAISRLIEKFEHQISTMPTPEPETGTMEIDA